MFWERFYDLCKEKGLTPSAVVKELGISHGVITKWKNGTKPNLEVVVKLCDYFNVTADYLIGITDDKHFSYPTITLDDVDNLPQNPAGKYNLGFEVEATEEKMEELEHYLEEQGVFYLKGNAREVKKTTAPKERPLSEIEKELLSLTSDMDEDEKNAVLGYAARIISKHKKED